MTIDRVLVTGANGFIGRVVAQRFRAQSTQVIGVDLRGDGDQVFAGDIADPSSWGHLLASVQVVVHTAALVTNAMKDEDMWRVNVLSTRNLIATAMAHRIRRFVHVSSVSSAGNRKWVWTRGCSGRRGGPARKGCCETHI